MPAVKVSAVAATAVKSVPATAVSPLSFDLPAQSTVTCSALATDSFTLNDTALPSVAAASSTLSDGVSASGGSARRIVAGRPEPRLSP